MIMIESVDMRERDYISGIRRGREIERQTNKSSVYIAWVLGFAFGTTLGLLIATIIWFI